jgi:XTP/dITP diphosphohydrolase
MREIIFVTSNKGKQASAQKHFNESEIKVICYDFEVFEPDVNDIEFIAKTKVIQAYKKVGKPCISLDAGFYIPNYPDKPDFPGAFPKRDLLEKKGIDGLLESMKDVKDRVCYFKECLAYYDGSNIEFFYGTSYGNLAYQKRGINSQNKWSDLWYVFIPFNCQKTLAEMSDHERLNRSDNHTNALIEFSHWYKKVRQKCYKQ